MLPFRERRLAGWKLVTLTDRGSSPRLPCFYFQMYAAFLCQSKAGTIRALSEAAVRQIWISTKTVTTA
jgi:hypothetical protein